MSRVKLMWKNLLKGVPLFLFLPRIVAPKINISHAEGCQIYVCQRIQGA
jgi:hypothetical protein